MRRHAFTLIELALVLVIVSLMTGFGLQAFESTSGVNCFASTQEQLKMIDRALQSYAATNSRYPKPSAVSIGSNDPRFGYEGGDGATPPSDPNYVNVVPAGVTNASGVLIGSLPHATLGLPANYASDCWGSKFTYAVANSQTGSDPNVGFRSAVLGTIALRTGNLSSNQQLSPAISYVVVSHGQDKYGATPMSAGDPSPRNCNGSTAGKVDRHNCDSDRVFYSAMVNTGDNNNYFDDLMVYSSKIQSTEDCPDQSVSWNTNCNGMSGIVNHNNSAVVASTAPNYWVGTTTVRCDDGVMTQTGTPTCAQETPCSATTITWDHAGAAGGPCSAAVAGRNHGQTHSAVPNAAAGHNGAVSVQCINGNFTNYSSVSCNPNPCTGSQNWGPGNNCTGSVTGLASGNTQSVSNTNSDYSGSATFSCSAGSLSITGTPTCTWITQPCPAGSVSWGAGCSAAAAGMAHNGTPQNLSNSAGGYSGSATVSCNNGTLNPVGTCFASCSARAETWSSCNGNTPAITHGNASSVSNTASGYTGAVTMSCSNGSLSQSGASCVADPPLPAGQMYCWGRNSLSRFGNGETSITNYALPQLAATFPSGVTSWKAVAPGTYHGCAIASNNQAYCWGNGSAGSIGNNTTNSYALPTLVSRPGGVTSWSKLSAGGDHNCAIANNNQLYCWGGGSWNALGNGSNSDRAMPTAVTNPSGVTGWVSVAGGITGTCGIANNGQAYCWGSNDYGQLGINNKTAQSTPTLVINPSGVTSWTALSMGNYNACGIGNNGRMYCWGMTALAGDGVSTGERLVPSLTTNPSGVSTWTRIDSGPYHNCGIANNGRIYCWGYNAYGGLGDNTTNASNLPVAVVNPSGVTSWTDISVANQHSCGLANNGLVYCWGDNSNNTIGDGTGTQRRVPTAVSLPGGVTQWGGTFIMQEYSCATAVGGGCIADNASSGGVAFNCCNGDSDGNGTCGYQPGSCGAAHGTTTNASAPSSGLCSSGVASSVSGSGPYNWTCGGTPCQAFRRCNAGMSVNWMTNCSGTTTGNNAHGFVGNVTNTAGGYAGYARVTCNNGSYSVDLANSACGAPPQCGSANGGSFATTPSSNLCAVGIATNMTGTGPYNWLCNNSGDNANCSANRSCSAGSVSWMSNCSAPVPLVNHGFTSAVNNTAAGYSGVSNVQCSQGVWSTPGTPQSCNVSAPVGCNSYFEVMATYYYGNASESITVNCPAGQGAAQGWYTDNSKPWRGSTWWRNRECRTCGTPVVDGACSSYPGSHASQPANDTASGCTAGTYADAGDDASNWRWTCNGSGGGTNASCSATAAAPTYAGCTDECGNPRAHLSSWCGHAGTPYGGSGERVQCYDGNISQNYDPGCSSPPMCSYSGSPAKTWQYVGQYSTTAAFIMPTFDSTCGSVEYSGCAGCTSFPAMSSCSEGADCTSAPHPTCLMNQTTCTMDAGHTAYTWDRYQCQ